MIDLRPRFLFCLDSIASTKAVFIDFCVDKAVSADHLLDSVTVDNLLPIVLFHIINCRKNKTIFYIS